MPRYNSQLGDAREMERASSQLEEAYDRSPVELDGMDELLRRLDDLVWDDPDLGTSMTLGYARTRTSIHLGELEDVDGDVAGLQTALDRVNARATHELDRYPAQGTDRHYSLDARRRNL